MIKSKMFPIDSKFKRFSLGKELTKNDLVFVNVDSKGE